MQRKPEEGFKTLLILSYFKRKKEYSYLELSELIGMPLSGLMNMLDALIEKGLLDYENGMLGLSFDGRVLLQKSKMEFYDHYNNEHMIEDYRNRAWPVDKIYIPEKL